MTERKRKALETKKLIFQKAMALMREQGYYGTRIEDVCLAAEVSIGAFYHHYSSKLDLFSTLYDEGDVYFETEVAPRLAALPPEARIVAYFATYAEFNQRMGLDQAKVLYHSANRWFVREGRAMQAVLTTQILAAQDRLDPTVTPEELTRDLFILARGVVYDWCLRDGGFDLVAQTVRLVERMLAGYKRQFYR